MTWNRLGQFKEDPQNLHELHLINVYKDEDFITALTNLADEDEYELLATKFRISVEEVKWFKNGHYTNRKEIPRRPKKPFRAVDREDGKLTIQFDMNITKEDYLAAWSQWFARSKMNAPQPKLPLHHELIYAIYKAREHDKKTFKQIFDEYQNGELSGYSGSNAMFANNQKKLEEYYRKYKAS